MDLSERDLKLIKFLEKNSNISSKELSKLTGIPVSTIFRKKREFEKKGIIEKYVAIVNHEKLGEPFQVLFSLNLEEGRDNSSVIESVKRIPQVKEIIQVQESWELLVIVRTKSLQELREVTNRIKSLEGVHDQKSQLILNRIYT